MRRLIGGCLALVMVPCLGGLLMVGMLMDAILGAAEDKSVVDTVGCVQVGVGGKVDGLEPTQVERAQQIIAQGRALGVPPRGWVVAIATAMQESRILNLASLANPGSLDYPNDGAAAGDHDSVGLFQQRDAWGPMSVRMDPLKSAAMFFTGGRAGQRGLLDIPGWDTMPVAEAAQAVQVSAYPSAYAQWETLATETVTALADTGEQAAGCVSASECPPTGLPVEAGLTPDALIVVRCEVQTFGITNLGGVRDTGSVSGSYHPSGRAVDIMVGDYQSAAGNRLGWEIAEWARRDAAKMGVSEVIFDERIWTVARGGEGWRPYTHPSGGSDTLAHRDHVHVSVFGDRATFRRTTWVKPIAGGYALTARFGDCGELWGSCHTGTDLDTEAGVPILAAGRGEITESQWNPFYGWVTRIDHGGGVETWYAHQLERGTPGGRVEAGHRIGLVGSTGNSTGAHLHFEVRVNGQPVDPEVFMRSHGITL